MALMTDIRQNMGLVIGVIAFALLAFILMDFFTGVNQGSSGATIGPAGTIAGQEVPYTEYSERVENALAQERQRSGGSIPEERVPAIREQVWNQMIQEIAFKREYDKLGIAVSQEEIDDMFLGPNPSQYVKDQFKPYFDQLGKGFNAQDMKLYLDRANENEEQKQALSDFAKSLRDFTAQQRYLGMVSKGYVGSNNYAKTLFAETSKQMNVRFVYVPYSSIADSTIKVSDSELRSYMKSHAAEYQQDEGVVVRYVEIPTVPTQDDTTRILKKLDDLREQFAKVTNDTIFTRSRSRNPYRGIFAPLSEVAEVVRDTFKNAAEGTIIGPIREGSYFKLYKLVGKKLGGEVYSNINQIFIPFGQDTVGAQQQANALAGELTPENFLEKARATSKDPNVEMGWYPKGLIGEDFDKAIEAAPKDGIVGPIKIANGFIFGQVVDKTTEAYSVAEIEEEVYAGEKTVKSVFKKINMVAGEARSAGELEKIATKNGVRSVQSAPLSKSSPSISGVPGSRRLVTWALSAREGAFSDIIRTTNGYAFAQITDKQSEGLKDLDGVKGRVSAEVINQRKGEKIAAKLQGANLEAIAKGYGPAATIKTDSAITYASPGLGGTGSEPLVIGTVYNTAQGKITKPIIGNTGVYVVQVTSVSDGGSSDVPATDAKVQASKYQDVLAGQSRMQSSILNALTELAEADDLRYLRE